MLRERAGSVSCHLPCALPAVAICVACKRYYCSIHFHEHRETFKKYVDDAMNHPEHLSNCLDEFDHIQNRLRTSIDNYERQAIEDLRQSADIARKTLENRIQNCRSHFMDESSTILNNTSETREVQSIKLEKLQNEYAHALDDMHIVQNHDRKRSIDIETTNPAKETFSLDQWKNVTPFCDPGTPKTDLSKRLVEKPLAESAVGNYWAIGASDEYLLAQEYENKQLTFFDRHGKRGISMTWHHDVVIRDIQWNHDLRQFFVLLDRKLILFDPVTKIFQEISRITPYQSNMFRRCTCRNDRLFISYWCQESAVELIQISSWSFQERWCSPTTCRANELIACIQLNANDQLALSIQDENNPDNRQCRFELRDLNLNVLRVISLDTDSGIFSRMTPLPDGNWAILNVDNNLVFILDEKGALLDKVDIHHGPLRNITLVGKHTIVIRAAKKLLFYDVEFHEERLNK